jgi:hypothetical protein
LFAWRHHGEQTVYDRDARRRRPLAMHPWRSMLLRGVTDGHVAELSPDQRVSLSVAAERLADEFAGVFGTETIESFLATSYDQFADRAKFNHFLSSMAERFARQRLRALATVEGKITDTTPVVLFLCVHNPGRSQMALGWFTHLAGSAAVGWSGGSTPDVEVNSAALAAMAEIGIDITEEFPNRGRTRSFRRPMSSSPWDVGRRTRTRKRTAMTLTRLFEVR